MDIFSRHPFRREPDDNGDGSVRVDADGTRFRRRPELPSRRGAWLAGGVLIVFTVAFRVLAGRWSTRREVEPRTSARQCATGQRRSPQRTYRGRRALGRRPEFPCPGRPLWDSFATMEHRRSPAVARQPVRDRSTEIRRCPRAGDRRTPTIGRHRGRVRTRPVDPKRAGRRATSPRGGVWRSASKRQIPPGSTLRPEKIQTRRSLWLLRNARPNFSERHRNREAAGEHGPRRTSRTFDDGRGGPRNYFMGFQTNAEAVGMAGRSADLANPALHQTEVSTVEVLGPNSQLERTFTPIDLGL